MNRITIIGNLTRDPEIREVLVAGEYRKVCNYTVAANRHRVQGRDTGADFFRVTVWDKRAEIAAKFLRMGSKVCVVGSVSARAYLDNSQQAQASLEVRALEVEYLSSAPHGDGEAPQSASAPAVDKQSGMLDVSADEADLPF